MNTGDKIASWISALLSNPVVGVVFGYGMGISETRSAWGFPDQGIAVMSALFLGVFPYLGALVSFAMGKTDIYVSKREQRPALFLVAVPPMMLGALYFYARGLPVLSSLLLLMLGESVILLAITTKWKISIHVSGLAFPLTVIWVRDGVTALAGFLLLPVLMWARVRTGAHTWAQVFASVVLSGAMTYCGAFVFLPSIK